MAADKNSGFVRKKPVDDYRAFMHELGHHLTSDNIQDIKYLIDLPGGERERIRSSVELFRALEEHNKISDDADGLDALCEIFRIILRHDLVRKVTKFKTERESASKQPVQTDEISSQTIKSTKTANENSPNLKTHPTKTVSMTSGQKANSSLKLLGPDAFAKPATTKNENSQNVPIAALNKNKNKAVLNNEASSATAIDKTKTPATVNEEKISEDMTGAEFSPSENLSVHPFGEITEKVTYAVPNFSSYKKKLASEQPPNERATEQQMHYPMDKEPKGICLIISNEDFDKGTDLDNREGTEKDVENIDATFKQLGFTVRTHRNVPVVRKDQEKPDMLKIITDLSNEDHSNYSCVVIFLLSHGCEQGIYGTDGHCLNVNRIFQPFKHCPSLSGKPKIFFGQFCRGDKEEKVSHDGDLVNSFMMVNHPKESDIYIGYSTPPGYVSFRSLTYGSWYISKLCKVFLERAHEDDLKTMMTRVNLEVTQAYTKQHCRQVPYEVSTLNKDVRFKPVRK